MHGEPCDTDSPGESERQDTMSEQNTPQNPPTEVHLTAQHVANLKVAYGDTTEQLVLRAQYVADALAYGVDVKTIAADLKAANRADATIPTPVPATLGYARFATTVAEMIGTTLTAWIARDPGAVADTVRVAHDAGIKVAKQAIADAVKPVPSEKVMAREEVAVTAITSLLERVKPEPVSTPRKTADEKTGGATGEDGETVTRKVSADMSGPTALDTIRTLTAWFSSPAGAWSPDLESALSDLRSAATASRKRGQGVTTTTPATIRRAAKSTPAKVTPAA